MSYSYFVTLSRTYRIDISDPRVEKVIICCSTLDQALSAQYWALERDDYRSVNIVKTKPYYSKRKYKVEYWDYNTKKGLIEG